MSDTGYIYAVICAVAQGMCVVVLGLCLERLLSGRDDRISKKKRMMLWAIEGVGTQGIKCLIPIPDIYLSIGNPIVMSLCFFFILKYCYRDSGVTKFVHAAILVIQNILSEVFYHSLWGAQLDVWRFPFENKAMAETCTVVAAISIFMNILYTVIVLNTRKKKREKTSPVWIAIMLLLILILAAIRGMRDALNTSSYFIFICIFAIMEFATLMLFLSQSERKEAQEEKQRTLEEVKKLRHIMELEKLHYEQIEARREEMAKIRHDYNNVITSVMYLIENGRTDEAEEIMKDLARRISQTKE